MPKNRRPSTIDGIKSIAKDIAKARSLIHARALDEAAKLAGFQNYAHAQRIFSERENPAYSKLSEAERRRFEFHFEARGEWVAACHDINPSRASSLSWTGADAIRAVLANFMGESANHVMLPRSGGVDFMKADYSVEDGCLEFKVGENSCYIAKPKKLYFERIVEREPESFFLLELGTLEPSGAYEQDEDEDPNDPVIERWRRSEELVDLGGGDYVERSAWDVGHLGYDERGDEIPLPNAARLVVRWMKGKMLIVCKRSMWNLDNGTYDGRHNRMTAAQIRSVIERSLREAS